MVIKQSVVDVLMFLFERYLGEETEVMDQRDHMHSRLEEMGFENNEIALAFDWLEDLATIQDSEFFNANDFNVSCARNISVENCTIFTLMLVQDAICPGYAVNVDVRNSWVCAWAYLDTTWESGGHDLNRNLYPSSHTPCHPNVADQFVVQSRVFATLTDLQNWDGDIDRLSLGNRRCPGQRRTCLDWHQLDRSNRRTRQRISNRKERASRRGSQRGHQNQVSRGRISRQAPGNRDADQ